MKEFPEIVYTRSSNNEELGQILDIQRKNIKKRLSKSQIASQGFVSVIHNLKTLRKMHESCPHILAKRNESVVGYALAMTHALSDVPMLLPLFEIADEVVSSKPYLVMGQICIDKPYRGLGLFDGMYNYYKQQLRGQYQCLITEVALENQRSLNAHKRVGFKTNHSRVENNQEWELLVWNWRE